MTPYDIIRKLRHDLMYMAPEELYLKFCRVSRAMRAVEDIHDAGPMTDAAEEAMEVLPALRTLYEELMFRINNQKGEANE